MASRTPPKPTPTEVIDDYRSAYIAFFGHPQPLISRGSAGGVIVRPIEGVPFRWTLDEMAMMTRFYRDMMEGEKAA